MQRLPRVSIVTSFLNAERFLEQAIQSVFAQTFTSWELLLFDDGSIDSSTQIARRYAADYPQIVKYLEHDGHAHRGQVVSRNRAMERAQGEYIAFLDSDDVWMPRKLEEQVAILEQHPGVSLVLGATQYWHSWDGKARHQHADRMVMPGVPANRIYAPPALLKSLATGTACVACPSDLLFRKEVLSSLGGFEEEFSAVSGMYEDQAFLAKVYLHRAVYVSDRWWDRYRLHEDSLCATFRRSGRFPEATIFYLYWLRDYLSSQGALDAELAESIRCRLRPYRHPVLRHLRRWRFAGEQKLRSLARAIRDKGLAES